MNGVMAMLRPRPVAFACLVIAAWCLWASPMPRLTVPVSAHVPTTLGLWVGRPLAVDRQALQALETDYVTLTEYRQAPEAPPVWLAQVSGLGTRAAFHPPELCYVGSHFDVLERGVITLPMAEGAHRVMRLVIGQGKERFEAWYWFTANGRVTPNYYQQQFWLLFDAVQGTPMAGTLVRISTPLDDSEASGERLRAFVTAFMAEDMRGNSHGS